MSSGKKRAKAFPGFTYDAKKRRAEFDGYVAGTSGASRRHRTIKNVTRAEALKAYSAFRNELATGRVTNDRMTFAQFIAAHYDRIAANRNHAPSTRKTQSGVIKSHLVRYFGNERLTQITSIRVGDLMADMRELGCAPSYINDAVRVLKFLLRQAVERDVIPEYPIKKKVPKERETQLRLELTRDERARFIAAFDDEEAFRARLSAKQRCGADKQSAHYSQARRFGGGLRGDSEAAGEYFERFRELRDYFLVAVDTGLRVYSDLLNLEWSSVHFSSGFIRVVTQKTAREAEIPISRACAEALRRCKARGVASTFVFVDARGDRYSPTRIRRTFLIAKELAAITRRVRLHDLRHTFGSRLADANISLPKIARALGHTSTRMAERYASPSTESMREIANALDNDTAVLADRPADRETIHKG